jgi:cytochrome c553
MRGWRAVAAYVGLAAAIGLVTVVSGVVPIKASSGHWPITAWLLHFVMRRSVATHAMGLRVPSLDAPWLALKGAAHYETGCRGCHGSPDQPRPVIARHMTPQPPSLWAVASEWRPAELFYVVKHGVKFTGMPAWPAQQRDDEVWAVVAFLLLLPGLDAEGYRRLVDGGASPRLPAPAAAEGCARCHGTDGRGRGGPAFPRLAGQRPHYLLAALEAFARGQRHSGFMAPVAAGLHPEEMRALAVYYGGLEQPAAAPPDVDSTLAIERGQTIAERGIPAQRVPSCAECHGPAATPRNPAYPVLAGQYADYLVLQLELFRDERRGGSAYAHLMRPVAKRLTQEQMSDVALYYQSLGR